MNESLIGTAGKIIDSNTVIDSPKEVQWDEPGWWRWLLECVDERDGSVTLRSDEGKLIVVRREGYRSRGKLAFRVGDHVRARFRDRQGVVYKVWWQDVRDRFVYMLDYGDRKSTRWYFADELELVEPRAAGSSEQER